MTLKQKSWLWKLSFPFAHANYTTIGEIIYFPKGITPPQIVIDHEEVHMRQQKEVGLVKFTFLYLFVFPLFWNPWRYKWEMAAYVNGSKFSEEYSKKILRSKSYGWLL